MKKILYFDFFSGGSEFYRLAPLEYLKSNDFQIIRSTEYNITWATLLGYDTVIIERPSSFQSLNIIKLAKDLGLKVISDWDDNTLRIDQFNPMYQVYQDEMASVIQCLVLSDEVWVSTKSIKKSFALYNKNIHVIPNAHNDYLFKVEDKRPFNPETKIAMYRGGNSHLGDIYDGDTPEKLIKVINGNPDWKFYFIGQRFEYLEKRCGDNYIAMSGSSTIQFHKQMHKMNPNLFFYPLADTVFNIGKSCISFLEATYSGAAFFGNKSLPEFNHTSVCNVDILGEWLEKETALSLKIANELSWDYIQENYLLSKVNKLREERLLA